MRRPLRRLLSGQPQIFCRLCRIRAVTVVMGQRTIVVVEVVHIQSLKRVASLLVQDFALLLKQRAIRHILRQRMLEDIFRFTRCSSF